MAISVLIGVFLGPMNECIHKIDVDTDDRTAQKEREGGGGGGICIDITLKFHNVYHASV